MKLKRLAAALLLALLPSAAAQEAARAPTLDQLKSEIGVSLRWLRSPQDVKTGAYGDLPTTALAVRAFAQSPWSYRPADGPFVSLGLKHLIASQRADGAIAAAGAKEAEARASTRAGSAALVAFP